MQAATETETSTLDEFRPTEGGTESGNDVVLATVAYVLFWLLLFGFVALTWKKQRAVEQRLSRLEAAGDRNPDGG